MDRNGGSCRAGQATSGGLPAHVEVAIIGAGPAGLNAAIQLARGGTRSALIDENPAIGGAIFRQPQKQPAQGPTSESAKEDKTRQRATVLFQAFEEARRDVSTMLRTQVVGADATNHELVLLHEGRLHTLTFDRLIIATGCHERPVPFPGWTLPGVASVGGLQLQIKSGAVRPGRRAVLVGTGPLLLVTAKNLLDAGMQVAGVFEMGRPLEMMHDPPGLLRGVGLLREGLELMRWLKASGVPIRHGWGIVEARGDRELSSVVVAPYDASGRPRREAALTLEADCLGVGYGFVPRVQLTQMLGCTHAYTKLDRSLTPVTDRWQRSSCKGVYVAGDVAGVYGSETAAEQGRLAALGCLIDLGRVNEDDAEQQAAPSRTRLRRLQRFRGAFSQFSALRPGLLELPGPDTPICRCEEVSRAELERAIDAGATTLAQLKMATRAGMGDCQGKMCSSYCLELLAQRTGQPPEQVGPPRPRFPLAPVPFSAFLDKEISHG